MNHSTPAGKTSRSSASALIALGVVGYFLSVGPVLVFAEGFGVSDSRFARPLRMIYAPLFATARAGRIGTTLYETYVGMWHRMVIGGEFPKDAIYP